MHKALIIAFTLCLVACGDDDDGGNSSIDNNESEPSFYWDCGNTGGLGLFFTWLAGGCSKITISSDQNPPIGSLTESTIASWTSNSQDEVEPNDTSDEAHPFFLAMQSGTLITGTVNDISDEADFVVFGSDSTNLISIYLCSTISNCLDFYRGNDIYLELFDQNNSLTTTTHLMQTRNGHEITFTPSSGLRYYVAVKASNTDGLNHDYKLVITD